MSEGSIVHTAVYCRRLMRRLKVDVYLPPYYDETRMRYPVVYLLHPWGADQAFWHQALGLRETADSLALVGAVPPFIAVMPQGDRSYFIDAADRDERYRFLMDFNPQRFAGALEGCGQYGSFIMEDLVPFIEKTFRVRSGWRGRAIGGIGMGGTGAAVIAFSGRDRFLAVGLHSPDLFDEEHPPLPWIFGLPHQDDYASRDPIVLARALDGEHAPQIYLDTGYQDDTYLQVNALHIALDVRGIPHAYSRHPGRMDIAAWREKLPHYLGFYTVG